MPNQEDSPTGRPQVDPSRPKADVDQYTTDGQSNYSGKGTSADTGGPSSHDGGGDSGMLEKLPGAGLSDRNLSSDEPPRSNA